MDGDARDYWDLLDIPLSCAVQFQISIRDNFSTIQ